MAMFSQREHWHHLEHKAWVFLFVCPSYKTFKQKNFNLRQFFFFAEMTIGLLRTYHIIAHIWWNQPSPQLFGRNTYILKWKYRDLTLKVKKKKKVSFKIKVYSHEFLQEKEYYISILFKPYINIGLRKIYLALTNLIIK